MAEGMELPAHKLPNSAASTSQSNPPTENDEAAKRDAAMQMIPASGSSNPSSDKERVKMQ